MRACMPLNAARLSEVLNLTLGTGASTLGPVTEGSVPAVTALPGVDSAGVTAAWREGLYSEVES